MYRDKNGTDMALPVGFKLKYREDDRSGDICHGPRDCCVRFPGEAPSRARGSLGRHQVCQEAEGTRGR